jgi:hypothetical protein
VRVVADGLHVGAQWDQQAWAAGVSHSWRRGVTLGSTSSSWSF